MKIPQEWWDYYFRRNTGDVPSTDFIKKVQVDASKHSKKVIKNLVSSFHSLLVLLPREKERMIKEYHAGVCNAEDAWRDFSYYEEKLEKQAMKSLKEAKEFLKKKII